MSNINNNSTIQSLNTDTTLFFYENVKIFKNYSIYVYSYITDVALSLLFTYVDNMLDIDFNNYFQNR